MRKIRQAYLMERAGTSIADIAVELGVDTNTAKGWVEAEKQKERQNKQPKKAAIRKSVGGGWRSE
jgi:transposase